MSSRSLENLIESWAENLSTKESDLWYNNPKGYLRKSADTSTSSIFNSFLPFSSYKKFWFCLNVKERQLRFHKDDNPSTHPTGQINMIDVVSLELSTQSSSPSYSFELIDANGKCIVILAAESEVAMMKWAHVLDLTRRKPDDIIAEDKKPMMISDDFPPDPSSSEKSIKKEKSPVRETSLTSPTRDSYSASYERRNSSLSSYDRTNTANAQNGKGTPGQSATSQRKTSINLRDSTGHRGSTSGPSRGSLTNRGSNQLLDGRKGSNMQEYGLSRFVEYQVTFDEPGPLMFNVVGTLERDQNGKAVKRQLVVLSFEKTTDRTLGRAEATGLIFVRDILTNVNDVSLVDCDFNTAVQYLASATWPKTIHFLRDNISNRDQPRLECWAYVYYPSLRRRRKRYIELRHNLISFRKPVIDGGDNNIAAKRDAHFNIEQIVQVRPIFDKTVPSEQRFTLQLLCKSTDKKKTRPIITHVDNETDKDIATSSADLVEICFPKQVHMCAWRSVLQSKDVEADDDIANTIDWLPMETIEEGIVPLENIDPQLPTNMMGIKNDLTGLFAPRVFTISKGVLSWTRIGQKTMNKKGKLRAGPAAASRSFFIANSSNCALTSVRLMKDMNDEIQFFGGFKYLLVLTTKTTSLTIGMTEEPLIRKWFSSVKDAVNLAPLNTREHIDFPVTFEKFVSKTPVNNTLEDLNADLTSSENLFEGFVFKEKDGFNRSDQSINNIRFRNRFVVLRDHEILYFRTRHESSNRSLALGRIKLINIVEVRESSDSSAPENSFEIITMNQIHLFFCATEDEMVRWIDIISDALESKNDAEIRSSVINYGRDSVIGMGNINDRRTAIGSDVIFSGALSLKSYAPDTSVSYCEYFFVIARGSLSYYASEDEFYDPDGEALADIALDNITSVASNMTDKQLLGKCFDVTVLSRVGGDDNGIRVLTLISWDKEECFTLMELLCQNAGTLNLVKRSEGVYSSEVNADAIKKRDRQRVQSAYFKPKGNDILKTVSRLSSEQREAAETAEEDIIQDESVTSPSRSSMTFERRGSASGALMAGRGSGAGNRNSMHARNSFY